MRAPLSACIAAVVLAAGASPRAAVDARETLVTERVTASCILSAAGACSVPLEASSTLRHLRVLSVAGAGSPWQITATTAGETSGPASSDRPPQWFAVAGEQRSVLALSSPSSPNAAVTITLEAAAQRPRPLADPRSGQGLPAPNTFRSQSVHIQTLGASVARLTVLANGEPARVCTAFLVTADIVMTNYHCVDGVETTATILAQFDYDFDNARGTEYRVSGPVILAAAGIATAKALDVLLLRLERPAEKRMPLALATRPPNAGANAILISHPGGAPKVVSLASCRIINPEVAAAPAAQAEVSHSCFTERGSSGAPVIDFDVDRVVALHHAGFERAGSSATNRAVRMDAIVGWLRTAAPDLHVTLNESFP